MGFVGILALIIIIISFCSWFISKIVYKAQVKNNYKYPYLASTLVFLLTFAILTFGIFFLIISNINLSR